MLPITADRVRSLFRYEPETGNFYWKSRSMSDFSCERIGKGFNTRFSGKMAGSMCGNGYIHIEIDGEKWKAHRLAWLYTNGSLPFGEVDHINGDRLDNRISNLRVVDDAGNARNRGMDSRNTSGRIGVYWHKSQKRWWAMITVSRRRKSLGYFDTIEDAAKARETAERMFGFHENHGRVALENSHRH